MMYEVTLRGTPGQMGTEHGAIIGQEGLVLPPLHPALTSLAADCERAAMAHTPAFVEEMRAFAVAASIDYETFMNFTLTIPLQQTLPSCSVVAILPERSANGKLMIGRNYDFSYEIAQGATLFHTYPELGYAHVGSSDIWIGREDGINEAGLFVAMSATFIGGVQGGLPFWFIVRHLLEHCASVDEALDWIQSVPHSQSRNYMLADANRAVVVEAAIDTTRVREAEDGVLVMTNHPMHADLRERMAFMPGDSTIRYRRLRALADGGVTVDDMKGALNDRENYVCAHSQINGQGFGTIWSVIATPEDRQILLARGTCSEEGTMSYRSYAL